MNKLLKDPTGEAGRTRSGLGAVAPVALLAALIAFGTPHLGRAADLVDTAAPLKDRIYAGCRLSGAAVTSLLSNMPGGSDPDYVVVYSMSNPNNGQLITNTTDYTGPVVCTRDGTSISNGDPGNIATTTSISSTIDILSSELALLLQYQQSSTTKNRFCHTADVNSGCFNLQPGSGSLSGSPPPAVNANCALSAATVTAIANDIPPNGNPTIDTPDVSFLVAYSLNRANAGGPVLCRAPTVDVIADGNIEQNTSGALDIVSSDEALVFQYQASAQPDSPPWAAAQTRFCHTVDAIADCFRIFPTP